MFCIDVGEKRSIKPKRIIKMRVFRSMPPSESIIISYFIRASIYLQLKYKE
jgi:hypothetical protein